MPNLTAQEHYDKAIEALDTLRRGAPGYEHIATAHATLAVASALIQQREDVGMCPHGNTGICMPCVIVNDLLRPKS